MSIMRRNSGKTRRPWTLPSRLRKRVQEDPDDIVRPGWKPPEEIRNRDFRNATEVEKGLAGARGGGSSDVTARTMSIFLRWLSDRDPKAYIVATCNSVQSMPPEYLRAERWDCIFFVDLPNPEEKAAIWKIWRRHYKVAEEEAQPDDSGWTGAEIRSCCRISRLLNGTLLEAAQYVLPISKTMKRDIDELRDWAQGKAIWASSVPKTGRELAL